MTLILISISSASAAENTTDLGNLISTATPNSEIQLEEGTYNNNVTNIVIDKNVTIIGKGADKTIIDAQKTGRIFDISSGGILTLINITLINGKTSSDGGAIYNFGTLTISGCTFSNNNVTSYSYGGAIYNNYESNLTIVNSTFNKNTAHYGGAIYNLAGFTTISNSTFTNNYAGFNGGAIVDFSDYYFSIGFTIINDSTFINNTAVRNGGAIDDVGNVTLVNCVLTNNTAYDDGGAIGIGNDDTLNLINCTFINNKAPNSYGGSIMNYGILNISNSTFINNTAGLNGGAIYSYWDTTYIIGSNFINNIKTIFLKELCNNTVINYNRFFNNTDYDINNNGININIDFNWWGSNNPNMSKIIGITPNNYFIMNVTNITSLDSNGTTTFQYTFKLNNSDSFDAILLPYFVTDVYTNLTTGVINSFDARYDTTFDVVLNTNGYVLYSFVTDNEAQKLEGNIVIPIPPEPPIPPKPPEPPIRPTPTPNPEPKDDNKTNNNPTVNAVMKETGIPLNILLLVFCSVLAILFGRKQY